MLSLYMTGSTIGLFIPASPQTHEQWVALPHSDGYNVTGSQEFSNSLIILWFHCHISDIDQNVIIWHMTIDDKGKSFNNKTFNNKIFVL